VSASLTVEAIKEWGGRAPLFDDTKERASIYQQGGTMRKGLNNMDEKCQGRKGARSAWKISGEGGYFSNRNVMKGNRVCR